MSSQQKRGFRLPWTAEQRGLEEASAAATIDQGTLDSAPAAVGDDLGEGPFHRAEAEPAMTADADPDASDGSEFSAEAEMINTDEMQDRILRAAGDGVWPTADRAGESGEPAEATAGPGASAPAAVMGPAPAAAGERVGRRDNPLVAGLVKAMREAAIASRAETTTRLQAEAATRIEAIRAESTDEAAALRKRVDDDIAAIREWSKVEMARIKAETEHRIEERRADAINESQRHLDAVEEMVGQVQATVSAFEADTEQFFQRLLAETDPARLAAMAEQAPETPDLSGDLPKPTGWTDRATDAPSSIDTDDDATGTEAPNAGHTAAAAPAEAQADREALEAGAAAEAEAAATEGLDLSAATEGLDLSTAEEWPAGSVMAAARRADEAVPASDEKGASRKLLVTGLTSVAGISAFKGAIGGLPGVRSVSVSTGERGVFVYTVNHEPETDIAAALGGLSAFAVQITEATDEGLTLTAHEPAA
jgi:hypothetical protein